MAPLGDDGSMEDDGNPRGEKAAGGGKDSQAIGLVRPEIGVAGEGFGGDENVTSPSPGSWRRLLMTGLFSPMGRA